MLMVAVTLAVQYGSGPSVVPVEYHRLPTIVPVNPLGTRREHSLRPSIGVVPVAATVTILLPGAYRHDRGATAVALPLTPSVRPTLSIMLTFALELTLTLSLTCRWAGEGVGTKRTPP